MIVTYKEMLFDDCIYGHLHSMISWILQYIKRSLMIIRDQICRFKVVEHRSIESGLIAMKFLIDSFYFIENSKEAMFDKLLRFNGNARIINT